MKNLLFIPFLLILAAPSWGSDKTEQTFEQMKSKYDNVTVYQQASTSSEVLINLEKDQQINVLRKAVVNGGIWSIVSLDGKPGYVLTSELYQEPVLAKSKTKKQKSNKSSKAIIFGSSKD